MPLQITEEEYAHVDFSLPPVGQALELAALRAHVQTDELLRRLRDLLAQADEVVYAIREQGVDVAILYHNRDTVTLMSFGKIETVLSLNVDLESY